MDYFSIIIMDYFSIIIYTLAPDLQSYKYRGASVSRVPYIGGASNLTCFIYRGRGRPLSQSS